MDLEFAAVAGAGIDVAYRKGATQQCQHVVAQPRGEGAQRTIGQPRFFGANSRARDLQEDLVHD